MDPQYKCEDCNSTFLEKKNYNKHMRNVHSEKKLVCQHCQFKTNDNSSLKRHIITHETKEEPPAKKIKCDQCFKTFSDKFNLNKHIKNVHGLLQQGIKQQQCATENKDYLHFEH